MIFSLKKQKLSRDVMEIGFLSNEYLDTIDLRETSSPTKKGKREAADLLIGLKEGENAFKVKDWNKFEERNPLPSRPSWRSSENEKGAFEKKMINYNEERRKLLESDPNYHFLYLVAGELGQQKVENLYEESDLNYLISKGTTYQLRYEASVETITQRSDFLTNQSKLITKEIEETEKESNDLSQSREVMEKAVDSVYEESIYRKKRLDSELTDIIAKIRSLEQAPARNNKEYTKLAQIMDNATIVSGCVYPTPEVWSDENVLQLMNIIQTNKQKPPLHSIQEFFKEYGAKRETKKPFVDRGDFLRKFHYICWILLQNKVFSYKKELTRLFDLSEKDYSKTLYDPVVTNQVYVKMIKECPLDETETMKQYFTSSFDRMWKQESVLLDSEEMEEATMLYKIFQVYVGYVNDKIVKNETRVNDLLNQQVRMTEAQSELRNRMTDMEFNRKDSVHDALVENGGYIKVRPTIISAIAKAYGDITGNRSLPWTNKFRTRDELLEFLQFDVNMRVLFAQLVANYVVDTKLRVPTQYLQSNINTMNKMDLARIFTRLRMYTVEYSIREGKYVSKIKTGL